MLLTFKPDTRAYILMCPYELRHLPKDARFEYDKDGSKIGVRTAWFTYSVEKAFRFLDYADPQTRKMLSELKAFQDKSLKMSRALDWDIQVPAPEGLNYLPYQKAGIAYMAERPATLLGDPMGLGKTIQIIGLINLLHEIKNVLIIPPANLKINWRRELEAWLVRPYSIIILDGRHAKKGLDHIRRPLLSPDIVRVSILNYDNVGTFMDVEKTREPLRDREGNIKKDKKGKERFKTIINIKGLGSLDQQWDLIVADEAHYLKNPDSARSRYCAELIPAGERRVCATGTPIPNRPQEGWPIFNLLDPLAWPNYYSYINTYCNAERGKYGITCEVPKDPEAKRQYFEKLNELQDKLRKTIMVRRSKKEALPQLPPKTRQVIEIPVEGDVAEVVAQEREGYKLHKEELQRLRVAFELSKASEDQKECEASAP